MKGLSKPITILFAAAVLFAVSARGQGNLSSSDSAVNYSTNGFNLTTDPSGTWSNSSIGGVGFDPWSFSTNNVLPTTDAYLLMDSTTNGASGHGGINSANGLAWGLFANGPTMSAYRHFWTEAPMQVGQTFQIDFENGYINSGGYQGFILQNASAQDRLEMFFPGGSADYFLNNSTNSFGIDTGIGFNTTGLHCKFTLTGPDTVNVIITGLNGNTNSFSTNGVVLKGTLGSALTQVRMYNSNAGAGLSNVGFFNNLAESSRLDDCAGFDEAANYTALSWTNLSNGGSGFNQWSFQPVNTNAGTSATYALGDSTSNGAGGHGGINSQNNNLAFGMSAGAASILSPGTNGATAQIYRPFSQVGGMTNGQSFTIDFENGYIFGNSNWITGGVTNFLPGGNVGLKLDDSNASERVELYFHGGDPNYYLKYGVPANFSPNTNYTISTPVGFTDTGLRCTFAYIDTNSTESMNVSIVGLNGNSASFTTNVQLIGNPGTPITQVYLYNNGGGTDTADAVFFNNFALSGNCGAQVVPSQITSIKVVSPNVLVTVPTVAGQSYQLETNSVSPLSLLPANWGSVTTPGGSAAGTGSSVTLTNVGGAVGASQGFYRVIIN